MKRQILPLFLGLCLLFSLMTVTALAVPEVTGNVGDDNGVVTTAGNGTTATDPAVTLPTTVAPATTVPTTTASTLPTTTAPTTTGTVDAMQEGNAGRVIGIILAVLIAGAILVLVILLMPRMRDKKGGR